MTHTDSLTRQAIGEHLNIDERLEYSSSLLEIIEEMQARLAVLHREIAAIPDDYATPNLVLEVAGKLSRNKRKMRVAAELDFYLDLAFSCSVRLARAHGCTWRDIGTAADEAASHLSAKYAH